MIATIRWPSGEKSLKPTIQAVRDAVAELRFSDQEPFPDNLYNIECDNEWWMALAQEGGNGEINRLLVVDEESQSMSRFEPSPIIGKAIGCRFTMGPPLTDARWDAVSKTWIKDKE